MSNEWVSTLNDFSVVFGFSAGLGFFSWVFHTVFSE